jgi:hypothetical protein
MKVEMNKKYTSNGCKVRILCVDGYDADYPVVAMNENGTVRYFTENGINADDKRKMWDLVEVWEPQFLEWCLFWDDEKPNHAVLAQFIKMYYNESFYCHRGSAWKYCAKFDGTLPEKMIEAIK